MKKLFAILLLFSSGITFGQIRGNHGYRVDGNSYYYGNSRTQNNFNQVSSTDSTITINANVLLNTPADLYFVTIALHQEAESASACDVKMDKTLKRLSQKLKTLNVSKNDYYVDFISHGETLDFDLQGNKATQKNVGFELKKNVIIKLKNESKIDSLIRICSSLEIYDIVKVDYKKSNEGMLYKQLYKEALKVIQEKKALLKLSGIKISETPVRINNNQFINLDPAKSYSKYTASNSSNVSTNSYKNRLYKKLLRKKETSYFNGFTKAGIDKTINGTSPKIGIQYVMKLSIVYSTK